MMQLLRTGFMLAATLCSPCSAFSLAGSTTLKDRLSLGIDYGTSGVRGCIIDGSRAILEEVSFKWDDPVVGLEADSAQSWIAALHLLLGQLSTGARRHLDRICISGTSGSALVYDRESRSVTRSPQMYNYNVLDSSITDLQLLKCGADALAMIQACCPDGSPTAAATSTLAKLLTWHLATPLKHSERLLHQSDYIANSLMEHEDGDRDCFHSDWHNALKLGYDVQLLQYPGWLQSLLVGAGINYHSCLPRVVEPGRAMGGIKQSIAAQHGIRQGCTVIAGTTDSIAAFIASGANRSGQAVSSLGSTLAIKALSDRYVCDSSRGIYSHRLGNQWLVGGASNAGCAIFRRENYSDDELDELSLQIDPQADCRYSYYPLLRPGERFPEYDPRKMPILDPKPMVLRSDNGGDPKNEGVVLDRREYLHGLLQSIAEIERRGYSALEELGATSITEVFTAGGGARNEMWSTMRARILRKKISKAANADASYGCALLGLKYENATDI